MIESEGDSAISIALHEFIKEDISNHFILAKLKTLTHLLPIVSEMARDKPMTGSGTNHHPQTSKRERDQVEEWLVLCHHPVSASPLQGPSVSDLPFSPSSHNHHSSIHLNPAAMNDEVSR
mmetsp:Transcript_23011/g.33042  ORF Transcript_23011/g.33042 Transcript_23011/m.33042 type:complete len:120 (+) Transcript_23011:1135-1494(+)